MFKNFCSKNIVDGVNITCIDTQGPFYELHRPCYFSDTFTTHHIQFKKEVGLRCIL